MRGCHFCAKWVVYFAHISRKNLREIKKSPKEKSFRANRAKWRAVFAQNLRTFPLGGLFRSFAPEPFQEHHHGHKC